MLDRQDIELAEKATVRIKFADGRTVEVGDSPDRPNTVRVRTLNHSFKVCLVGAVNVADLEMVRFGKA